MRKTRFQMVFEISKLLKNKKRWPTTRRIDQLDPTRMMKVHNSKGLRRVQINLCSHSNSDDMRKSSMKKRIIYLSWIKKRRRQGQSWVFQYYKILVMWYKKCMLFSFTVLFTNNHCIIKLHPSIERKMRTIFSIEENIFSVWVKSFWQWIFLWLE